MRWRDRRLRHQEGARDLLGGQAADHPQRQRRARLARQQRMAGGEDQPQQFVADVVVQRGVQIGHGLLLLLQVARDHLVLAREHPAAAQMIERPALGGRHQPGAGLFRNAGRGQCSSAATSASCVRSSASGTSRSIRARLVISRGCSIRQTARMARWVSAAVIAADGERDRPPQEATCASTWQPFRTGVAKARTSQVPSQPGMWSMCSCMNSTADRHGLFLVAQFEDRIAADQLLGLDERAVDDAELAVRDPDLRAHRDRHQPATVEHPAGLDLPVGELVHGLHQRRRRVLIGLRRGNDIHEAHLKTPC